MEQIPDKMKETDTFVEDHTHFKAKPMFEVFSVTIHLKDDTGESLGDGKACHIRGIVGVIDEDGTTHELYNRKSDNAEIINLGGSLSLTNIYIIPFKVLRVAILLYDSARDIQIAQGVFDLDYSEPYDYNKVHLTRVDGEHGFANVYHSTFQYAVVGHVKQVKLCKNVGPRDPDNHLYGTVTARLKRTLGLPPPGDVNNHEFPITVLFDNRQYSKQSTYVEAWFNAPIKLFRSHLVAPIDCCLIIEANFCDDTGLKFSTNLQLNPSSNGGTNREQYSQMWVEVFWYHPYDPFPREAKVGATPCAHIEEDSTSISCSETSQSEVSSDASDGEQPMTFCAETTSVDDDTELSPETLQPSSSVSRGGHVCGSIPLVASSVEVFSVLIHVNDNDLDVYGTIKVTDAWHGFYIFNGKETCHGRKTLPILGPTWSFTDEPFLMEVNLKDDKGRVVSKGFFEWFYANNHGPISFYDRHICSVIHGDIGYAVVHYSMFTYSIQARIRVSLVLSCSIPEAFANVFGRISGAYSNYEYPTPYDQEFYSSTIFYKPRDDSVRVDKESGSTLPLLKCLMSVPLENSLILDVNLNVIGPFGDCSEGMNVEADKQNQQYSVISKLVEFKPNVDGYFVFEKGDYVISIGVEWVEVGAEPPKDPRHFFSRPALPNTRSLKMAMQKALLNA